ncbi:MAG: methylglyoxal synthase [Acaryochloris sp. SU_5_25]|nr:methylglyoxal synthase [Acaryochloris sp. SU_5_25]
MSATIALIAHDRMKDRMVAWARQHQPVLTRYHLIATGTTGQRIQEGTNLAIDRMLSGPMGGDAQIATQVAEGKVAAVIFLIDPLYAQPHEPDIQALKRICAVYDVPLAINVATAEAIINQLRQAKVAHLIFNPVSGQGNADQDLVLIEELLSPAMKLVVHLTTSETDPQELVQSAIAAQADLVLASGGDGTISAVAAALFETQIPLGIIPRGTANAFAAALNISAGLMPIRKACDIILQGKTLVVDVAKCNDQPMILLAGIGLEAEVIDRADREAKNRWGALAYIMEGIKQLNQQELFETEIEVEGVVKTFQAGAVTIANAAPPTSVMAQGAGGVNATDGLLDITIGAPQTDLEAVGAMVNLVGAALLRKPTNRADIINLRTRRVKVVTNPPQKVVVDGEMVGTTPIEVECIPQSLIVFAPESIA